MAESILDGEMPIKSGFNTIDIVAMIGLIGTVLNSFLILIICNKLRTLAAVLLLIRTVRGENILKYDEVTVQPYNLIKAIEKNMSWDHVITFLIFFNILIGILLLRKLNVFKRKRLTTLNLHISNGIRCIDVCLLVINSCYIEWNIITPTKIDIFNVEGFLWKPKLKIDTRLIEVKNKITNQVLLVPADIKLSYMQAWKIRKLLRTTYYSKIYINHNNKLIKINLHNENNR